MGLEIQLLPLVLNISIKYISGSDYVNNLQHQNVKNRENWIILVVHNQTND